MNEGVPLVFNKQKLVRVVFKRIFIIGLGLSTTVCAQTTFTLPLKEKVFLTGNYGEIRPNHFHAGLDFKTDPVKHLPIYCVADGYVSRIKVGTHGYGKVLYITHANGKVSVYGHQYVFNDNIKKYVNAAQEMFESFEVELFPQIDELKVKQGEIIGYTGNTGDSEGPHLHFEIRDEKSEVPLNPMRFLQIIDTVAPTISSVAVYEEDYTMPNFVNFKKKADTLQVGTKMGIGVACFDLEQRPGNKNNVYAIELLVDGAIYHRQVLDSIPFDMARYVNTYCDYDLKREKKIAIQKCFKGKNNDLPIYKNGHSGFLYLEDTLYHAIKVKVYDYFKQSAEVSFVVKRKPAVKMAPIVVPPYNCLSPYKKINDDYIIDMPAKSLYKDVWMTDTFRNNMLIVSAAGYNAPLQKKCIIKIKPTAEQLKYKDKLCLMELSTPFEKIWVKHNIGGTFEDGFVKSAITFLGKFMVGLDTIAPIVKHVKPKNKKTYKSGDLVFFNVYDSDQAWSGSGIDSFKVFVNDKFTLAEYEHKTGMVFFEITDKTPRGKITVRLELSDKKNNKSVSFTTITCE